MIQECALIYLMFLQISLHPLTSNEMQMYNHRHVGHMKPRSIVTNVGIKKYDTMNTITKKIIEEKLLPHYDLRPNMRIPELHSNIKSRLTESQQVYRRFYMPSPTGMMSIRPLPDWHGPLSIKPYSMLRPGFLNHLPRLELAHNMNAAWSTPLHPHTTSELYSPAQPTQVNTSSIVPHNRLKSLVTMTTAVSVIPQQIIQHNNLTSFNKFTQSLDNFERRFYQITFSKLSAISPADRQENGMSFVQSGFFLLLTLMALWKEVDSGTRAEIDNCIGFHVSDVDSVGLVRHFMTTLPNSSDKLKFRRSSRLMLWPGKSGNPRFEAGAAAALMLQVGRFNGTETPDNIVAVLNRKVELDSGGAIHETFEEDDVSGGVTAVLVSTLYVRARWRAAPTVLNGSVPFRDAGDAPRRSVRMIRINDLMNYADLADWNAQALEISYATPGLSLLMLIPRGNSLRALVDHASSASIGDITAKMRTVRVAATVPIYTLRMTLLLPNKLQALGIPTLVDVGNATEASSLRLSHAVQRIMFWAEAGRNAYKDDGIEWDQPPELRVFVDRPYIFFVRWRNVTLINGNFVL